MTSLIMGVANNGAPALRRPGLEQLIVRIHQRDALLRSEAPDAVGALIAAPSRSSWTLPAACSSHAIGGASRTDFHAYHLCDPEPDRSVCHHEAGTRRHQGVSGSTPGSLVATERAVSRIVQLVAAIVPPGEFVAAHALPSAPQLARLTRRRFGARRCLRRHGARLGRLVGPPPRTDAQRSCKSDIQTLLARRDSR